jgi:hypothetical protein
LTLDANALRNIIQTLAQLSPKAATPAGIPTAISTEWFRWVDVNAVNTFMATGVTAANTPGSRLPLPPVHIERAYAEELAKLSQLRGSVRLGWLFAAGQFVGANGRKQKVFEPLVSARVRVVRQPIVPPAIERIGDPHLTELVRDVDARHDLEARMVYGGGGLTTPSIEAPKALLERMPRLQAFARDLARAAGFGETELVPATAGPEEFMKLDHVVVVAGVGLYTSRAEAPEMSRASSLRRWSEVDLGTPTALHALYGESEETDYGEPAEAAAVVQSPIRLTPTQSAAVVARRTMPVSVIQGAPGTGKSQTLVAIALDAVERGDSVLVVAKSDSTVDALAELLQQSPGPEPVIFGSSERREALAQRLSAGALKPLSGDRVAAARQQFDTATARVSAVRAELTQLLEVESVVDRGGALASGALSLNDARARRERLAVLVANARTADGFLAGRRRRQAVGELRGLLPCDVDAPADVALELAQREIAQLAARDVLAAGGVVTRPLWDELLDAVRVAREAHGEWLSFMCRSRDRLDGKARAAVNALATALRSGRAARREQLRHLGRTAVTNALPLWIGTLVDVDDLLPMQAGFFDLVILDEAASIDQSLAAPGLLRGKRVVVAGDPRQLRPVSFLSDDDVAGALDRYGIADPVARAKLDLRRNSVLDIAVGVAEPLVLDEQFRSDPHLIEFVAHRFYGGRLKVAARKPSTHSCDCIDVRKADGKRTRDGVVKSEVDAVLSEIRRCAAAGVSIGVLSPFRAQANALEDAIRAAHSADELEAMDLRVGTVHGFQGIERDVVIASLGVGDGASWAFVEDEALAAVLFTLARRRFVLVYSGDPPPGGLIAAYLAQADAPPGPPTPSHPPSSWARAIADGAQLAGLPLLASYPAGRHTVDLVVADTSRDVAIETDIHPHGVASHIRRRLELIERGWVVKEAYRSRWENDRAQLVVDLVNDLKQ